MLELVAQPLISQQKQQQQQQGVGQLVPAAKQVLHCKVVATAA
jgi:hypothetical protein